MAHPATVAAFAQQTPPPIPPGFELVQDKPQAQAPQQASPPIPQGFELVQPQQQQAPAGYHYEDPSPLSPIDNTNPRTPVLKPDKTERAPEKPWNEQLGDWLMAGGHQLADMVRGQTEPSDLQTPIGKLPDIRKSAGDIVEGSASLPGLAFKDPKAAFQSVDPTYQAATAYNNLTYSAQNALRGDWQKAGENFKEAEQNALNAELGLIPFKGIGKARPVEAVPVAPREAIKTLATVATDAPVRPQALKAIDKLLVASGVPRDRIVSGLSRVVDLAKEANGRALTVAQLLQREFGEEFPQTVENIQTVLRGRALSVKRGDQSPSIINTTAKDMRSTQAPYLAESASRNLGDASRMGTREEVKANLKEIGDTAYKPIVEQPVGAAKAQQIWDVLRGPGMGELAKPLKQIAAGEGVDLEWMVENKPVEAAHWMQHKARLLAESNQGKNDAIAYAYSKMRERILKTIDDLPVPGKPGETYKSTREKYGDEADILTAADAGNQFGSQVRNPEGMDQFLAKVAKMTPDQRSAALASIRDWVHSRLRGGQEDAPARINELTSVGTLDALERLGPEGKALAADFRAIRSEERDFLQPITQRGKSQTATNQQAIKEGDKLLRGGGSDLPSSIGTDVAGMATGVTHTPIFTALKFIPDAWNKLTAVRTKTGEDVSRILMARQREGGNVLGEGPPNLRVIEGGGGRGSGGGGNALAEKPSPNELRISETINELRRSPYMTDDRISEHLAMYGINIKPERIEHFAKMTPRRPPHQTNPKEVERFAERGRKLKELRGLGYSEDEIANALDLGGSRETRQRIFDAYERAADSADLPRAGDEPISGLEDRSPPRPMREDSGNLYPLAKRSERPNALSTPETPPSSKPLPMDEGPPRAKTGSTAKGPPKGGPSSYGVPVRTPDFDGQAAIRKFFGEPSKYMPWRGNPRFKELADKAGETVGEVPVSSLKTTQSQLRHNYKEIPERYNDSDADLPQVVRENGVYYIRDGNHRIAAQVESGAQTIRARIIDLDGSPAKPPPPMDEGARLQKGNALSEPPPAKPSGPKVFNTKASIKDAPQELRDIYLKAPEGISQREWDAARNSVGPGRLPGPRILGIRIDSLKRKASPFALSAAGVRRLKALEAMLERLNDSGYKFE